MLKRYISGLLAVVLAFGILAWTPQPVNAAVVMGSSDAMKDVLKAEEGFSAKPYWDHAQWTVGYGTKCPTDKLEEYKTNGISREAAQALFEAELKKIEAAVNSFAATYDLTFKQNQFDALVSFSYNCGTGWINETTGYFNKAVRQGDMGNAFLYGICLWSSAGGEYTLIDRRMSEANMYINGQYRAGNAGGITVYPDNFRWVYLDGNGGEVKYKLHAYNAADPKPVGASFSSVPTGVDKNGKAFSYTLAGWYTEDGKQVKALDSSLSRGQVLYAKWKDPAGNIVSLPKGQTPKAKQVVVTGAGVNIRSGPGTHYPKVGTAAQGAVLAVTEVYETSSYTWGKTPRGWLSLSYTNYAGAPVITRQPASGTATNGSKVSITLEAVGTGLRYQWYVALPGSDYFHKSSVTSNTYSTTMDAQRNGRRVYCVVTDGKGNSVRSKTATLNMDKTLAITQQPVDTAVPGGSTATVKIKAVGKNLSYQWYLCDADSDIWQKSSIKTDTYMADMNGARYGRRVYCEVTDAHGSKVRSETVTITSTTPVIKEQPKSVTVVNGETASVSVTAAGKGLKYQWYICNAGSKVFSQSSTKTSTYSVEMNASRAGRKLYCQITDGAGKTVKTDVVTLNWDKTLTITQQPAGVMTVNGGTAAVQIQANGEGLRYQWYICNAGGKAFSQSSTKVNTYSVEMNASRDGRKLYCVVTDAAGKTLKSDIVSINTDKNLFITKQPQSVAACQGQVAKIRVGANGRGLRYQWYICNAGATQFSKSSIVSTEYAAEMNASRDGRKVYCVITDAAGNTVQTETVTMRMVEGVKITQQPENMTADNGQMVEVTLKASGTGLSYQWYYRDLGTSEFKKSSIATATYLVQMNAARNGRQLYCVVTDAYGNSVKSNTVTIKVTGVRITQQPQNVAVPVGGTVNIPVKAEGTGLTYQWYLALPGVDYFHKSSVTTSSYVTTMDDARNGRRVYCIITDAYGNSVKTNTVTMKIG